MRSLGLSQVLDCAATRSLDGKKIGRKASVDNNLGNSVPTDSPALLGHGNRCVDGVSDRRRSR